MKSIILVGFMGCGKSTLGKKLAKKLNVPFLDSDHEIEASAGLSVSQIFEKHGETYFRNLEREFLMKLNPNDNFVLSTGGGMPCLNENMNRLNELGAVLYLKLSPQELTKRLLAAKKTKRPLIEGKTAEDLQLFIAERLEARNQFYLQAPFILKGKEQNVKHILEILS